MLVGLLFGKNHALLLEMWTWNEWEKRKKDTSSDRIYIVVRHTRCGGQGQIGCKFFHLGLVVVFMACLICFIYIYICILLDNERRAHRRFWIGGNRFHSILRHLLYASLSSSIRTHVYNIILYTRPQTHCVYTLSRHYVYIYICSNCVCGSIELCSPYPRAKRSENFGVGTISLKVLKFRGEAFALKVTCSPPLLPPPAE